MREIVVKGRTYQTMGSFGIVQTIAEIEQSKHERFHPTIANREATRGKRYVMPNNKVTYVPEHEREEFEKAYGRRRSSYADDLTEDMRLF